MPAESGVLAASPLTRYEVTTAAVTQRVVTRMAPASHARQRAARVIRAGVSDNPNGGEGLHRMPFGCSKPVNCNRRARLPARPARTAAEDKQALRCRAPDSSHRVS